LPPSSTVHPSGASIHFPLSYSRLTHIPRIAVGDMAQGYKVEEVEDPPIPLTPCELRRILEKRPGEAQVARKGEY
jgi:hypothetical protein